MKTSSSFYCVLVKNKQYFCDMTDISLVMFQHNCYANHFINIYNNREFFSWSLSVSRLFCYCGFYYFLLKLPPRLRRYHVTNGHILECS